MQQPLGVDEVFLVLLIDGDGDLLQLHDAGDLGASYLVSAMVGVAVVGLGLRSRCSRSAMVGVKVVVAKRIERCGRSAMDGETKEEESSRRAKERT